MPQKYGCFASKVRMFYLKSTDVLPQKYGCFCMFVEYPLFSGARALSSSYKKSFGKKSYISYTRHQNFPYLLAVSGEGLGVGFHFQGVGYPYFTCKTAFQSGETDGVHCKMHKETARFESVSDGVIVGGPERNAIATVPTCPCRARTIRACFTQGAIRYAHSALG